ncbi:MAG TPA: ArsA-related P-loop ATPase [Candidatus Solibacter sp.]|jgi:anion-transporting  ArsA/GET3 family ATPase|nr:ArsA-related P-loop ATPase [Candidatus Solibacter sp.]
MTVDELLKPGILVLCGSDGVGKTTTAAALAARAAVREDMHVAVLTIDPARRLANAMGLAKLGNRLRQVNLSAAAATTARGKLEAGMLETKSAWDQLIIEQAGSREKADKILANPFYKEISGAFVGSHEYIAMERLYDLHQSDKYDLIVLDTPPSRNALDFLEAPNRMTELVSGGLLGLLARPGMFAGKVGLRMFSLTAKPIMRIADNLLGGSTLSELSEFLVSVEDMYGGFKARAEGVYSLLGQASTSFLVVTTLEDVPFEEARFFVEKLSQAGMHLVGAIVNKRLPSYLLDPAATNLARRLLERSPPVERALAENFLAYRTLGQRDNDLMGRIAELGVPLLGSVPRMSEPVGDLSGLLEVGRLLAEGA